MRITEESAGQSKHEAPSLSPLLSLIDGVVGPETTTTSGKVEPNKVIGDFFDTYRTGGGSSANTLRGPIHIEHKMQ